MSRASAILVIALAVGCRQDMHDNKRLEPLEASTFFADGRASRPLVAGTVARGHLNDDDLLYRGKAPDAQGAAADTTLFPFPVTREVVARGRQRFDIYCSPCHDRTGGGNGLVVQRGFKHPPSFHTDRLREAPAGHFFDVMTNGFGAMSDYAAQVPVEDRWAIVAYIRALQLSQRATIEDVPQSERPALEGGGT